MMLNILGGSVDKYSGGMSKTDFSSKTIPGDPEVSQLWSEYVNPNIPTYDWVFRKRVLSVAMRLFQDHDWFRDQERNANLHGYNYGFVVDTMRFIATGKRKMSLSIWSELVTHEHTQKKDVSKRHEIIDLLKAHSLFLATPPVGMLQKWCSHPEGIDDLLWSLNILFGDLSISHNTVSEVR
tara:strand:+ start:1511 stop:2053 length:543 start_codon:yes stop_codon:yes gene_type:complete